MRKEESQLVLPSTSDNIVTELPTFKDARSNYYCPSSDIYSQAQPDALLHEIETILANEPLNDEDKQELLKMTKEIRQLKEESLVQLGSLSKQKVKEKSEGHREVELQARIDLKSMEERVDEL